MILLSLSNVCSAKEEVSLDKLEYNSFIENAPSPEDVKVLREYLIKGINFVYLGEANGSLDLWLSMKDRGFQLLATTLDGKSIVFGPIYDEKGNNIMLDVIKERMPSVGEALYILSSQIVKESMDKEIQSFRNRNAKLSTEKTLKEEGKANSVSDIIWDSLEHSYFVEKGNPNAPMVYVFTDIFCGHCTNLYKNLKTYVDRNIIRVRYIPIGILSEKSLKSLLGIMSSENYVAAWSDYYDNGNTDVINTPATAEGATRLQHNIKLFDEWNLKGTPSIFYKNIKGGDVKFLHGEPNDIESFINDITS